MQWYRAILLSAVVSFMSPAFAGMPFYEPSDQEEKTADYGAYPYNYKELVIAYMKREFQAPSTAHYLFIDEPRKDTNLAKRREDVIWGYWVQVEIDTDGSNNSYTWRAFFIRDGKILRMNHSQPPDRPSLFGPIKAMPANSGNFQMPYSVNGDGDGIGEQPDRVGFSPPHDHSLQPARPSPVRPPSLPPKRHLSHTS